MHKSVNHARGQSPTTTTSNCDDKNEKVKEQKHRETIKEKNMLLAKKKKNRIKKEIKAYHVNDKKKEKIKKREKKEKKRKKARENAEIYKWLMGDQALIC
jgi:hypothetical protein